MQRSTIGVGPALRTVREQRGLTLEEAARDTRVRREFLEALEEEEFDRLLGDVHVRGCLRTYATYLRLSPDKVVAAYAVDAGEAIPTPPPGGLQEPALGGPRRRDNHRLIVMAAATVLVLAAAFGLLSAQRNTPAPADLPSEAPPTTGVAAETRPITVAVTARRDVEVTITADGGEARPFELESGEGRSFEADRSLTVGLSVGGSANIVVNGKDEGFPGSPDEPWEDTYSYAETSSG